jgi:hypothetical protein
MSEEKNITGKDKNNGETEDDGPGLPEVRRRGQEIFLCNGI